MKKISIISVILLSASLWRFVFGISSTFGNSSGVCAQDIAIGQWKDHFSYKSALSVAEGNGKTYCATKGGVFTFNKADNSVERLTKVNGLSDVEATLLNFNKNNNKLLIAYSNSNIDIIDNGTILNLADIKRKSIIGNKSINNIYFINQYAYLACGFGIVIIDMNKIEVSDTYYIGPNGNAINVMDITSDGTYIYAATIKGIYKASLSNPNLANFTSWTKMAGIPDGIYNTITSFNNKIYTNFSKKLLTGAYHQDTMYVYDNTAWNYFPQPFGYNIKELRGSANRLIEVEENMITLYNLNLDTLNLLPWYFNSILRANEVVVDNNDHLWIADSQFGLVKNIGWGGANFSYYPSGPASNSVSAMSLNGTNLWVAPGRVDQSNHNLFFVDGLYSFHDGDWWNPRGDFSGIVNTDTIHDFINVYVDPNDSKRSYAASWWSGVVEFYNDVPVKLYNQLNSSLRPIDVPNYYRVRTNGLTTDASGNLWVTNSGVPNSVSKKNINGTWQSLNFFPIIGIVDMGQILVDKNDQKWVILSRGGGLMVYQGETMAAPSLSNTKKLTMAIGNGALPSTGVYAIAEDLDGEIWVGTDKGITVFYSPENVFSGQNFDAQQILLEQDGHVQILLETELIQAIVVDDANRKWIATGNSGVFLMSADGTKQIYHFDEKNSPLFSNDVKSMAINHETGEVYFGTTKGIISFRGTATKGMDDFSEVYAFPNPVKPDYDGPIAIKGLMDNTTLKITDISGSLVFEVKSEGGQAIWYGKNFKGEKVSTGVYMVFCTNEDGSKKTATKILFIN